jgi:segregation and condensation protein B
MVDERNMDDPAQLRLGAPVGLADGPVEQLRIVEALLFAAAQPLDEAALAERLPRGADLRSLLMTLQAFYAPRGVNLVRVAGKWAFRTAEDLSFLLHRETTDERKLSRAALETLAIVAYHQPVTRAEIEEIRGVTVAKGTIDLLMETGWLRIRGRRKVPGRPVTFGTTPAFLDHFGLEAIGDLPGLDDLKAAGMLDGRLPPGFRIPIPNDDLALREDEEPDDGGELDLGLTPLADRGAP